MFNFKIMLDLILKNINLFFSNNLSFLLNTVSKFIEFFLTIYELFNFVEFALVNFFII